MLGVLVLMLAVAGNVWAVPVQAPKSIPEIDAGSGTGAIALLSGTMLLLRKKMSTKQASKSDK